MLFCKPNAVDRATNSHFVPSAFLEEVNVTCNNGDIRLIDGRTEFEGKVEICYDNHWGGICGRLWDSNEANVACRQLGYISVGESAHTEQQPTCT